jgi:hypothetical protein
MNDMSLLFFIQTPKDKVSSKNTLYRYWVNGWYSYNTIRRSRYGSAFTHSCSVITKELGGSGGYHLPLISLSARLMWYFEGCCVGASGSGYLSVCLGGSRDEILPHGTFPQDH